GFEAAERGQPQQLVELVGPRAVLRTGLQLRLERGDLRGELGDALLVRGRVTPAVQQRSDAAHAAARGPLHGSEHGLADGTHLSERSWRSGAVAVCIDSDQREAV